MKKLILLIVALFVAGIAMAHGPRWQEDKRGWRNNWKNMDQHHNLMHDSQVEAENVDQGVKIEMTSKSKTVQESIQKEFLTGQENLKNYFTDVEVTVKKLDEGVELTLTGSESRTVEQLQRYGDRLVYQYLRDKVHSSWAGRGGYRGHHGRGGGWGCGWGSNDGKWKNGPMSFRWVEPFDGNSSNLGTNGRLM